MKELLRLVLVLTLIAAGAGLALSLVEGVTREPIAEQRRLITLNAIRAVLPPVDNAPDEDAVDLVVGTDRRGKEVTRSFYRGRQEGKVVGVAFRVIAPDGYSGNIEVMVGVSPEGIVEGIEVLRHAETPGLGDKIEEEWFRNQFKRKGLEGTDWRVKKDGGEFDQITGATISARAVVSAVRDGARFYQNNRQGILAARGDE